MSKWHKTAILCCEGVIKMSHPSVDYSSFEEKEKKPLIEKIACWLYGSLTVGMILYVIVAWILKTYFGIEGL